MDTVTFQIAVFMLCIFLVFIATIIYILKRRKDPDSPKDATIIFGKGVGIPIVFKNLCFKDEIRIAILIALVATPIIILVLVTGVKR